MGRILLLSWAAALLAACSAGPVADADSADPHAALTCASCHEYTLATQTQLAVEQLVNPDSISMHAPVPGEGCTASGCHPDAGPREVEFRSVSFEHRRHGGDTLVAMSCAGCHFHDAGGAALTTSVDACSLCHLSDQAAGNAGECRLCHTSLEATTVSTHGLEVPHSELPWLEGECVRCHFDVTRAPVAVSILSCRQCHSEEEEMVARGIGEDLHASHTAVGCLACHEGESHRIRAMSTSVELSCNQCHSEAHTVSVTRTWPGTAVCDACHVDAHLPQRRLMLGLVPGASEPMPSDKFLAGLTCRSCHQAPAGSIPGATLTGTADGCRSCHLDEYGIVLQWWMDGSESRLREVQALAGRAASSILGPEEAVMKLDSARALLELIEEAGPEHNLPFSHRLLVTAADQIAAAYLAAERTPPPIPKLGREPSMGLCSYCHYRENDPWLFDEMSGAFHQEAMRNR